MQAYRVETTVQPNSTLTLDNLPFHAGEKVEVIILANPAAERLQADEINLHPLRGTPVIYHDPFEPAVPDSDWDVYNDSTDIFPQVPSAPDHDCP